MHPVGRRGRQRGRPRQRGMALISMLVVITVLALVGSLVLYMTGKEIVHVGLRLSGAEGLNVAEGGAVAARAALMAFVGADPLGIASVSGITSSTAAIWWANGNAALQTPFALLSSIVLDGLQLSLGTAATSATTTSVVFHVNMGAPNSHLKLQTGGPVTNALGNGSYQTTVTLTKRLAPHASCSPAGSSCYIHRLPGSLDSYQFNYTYTVDATGAAGRARRRVVLAGDFNVVLRRQNFARYALFTQSQVDPNGTLVYFNRTGEFDGPVHTNGEFGFREFPKFGTRDPQTPCSPSRIQSAPVTSASVWANFWNNGSPRRLQANENVVSGVRRDAPVLPDCTASQTDDGDNPPANFTRGVAAIALPPNTVSQKRASIGGDPTLATTVTNLEIRQAVPELVNSTSGISSGIYIPVVDTNGNCLSENDEPLGGGIYVQGNLDSLTHGVSGNNAVYTLRQGSRTVTITVDRTNSRTTVSDTAWPGRASGACPSPHGSSTATGPATRTFQGVPKGLQTHPNNDAMIIYVEGTVNALSGTLEQKEQATIAATGDITISGHLVYQVPPVTTDTASNPLNLLGLFTTRDILIGTAAPNDLNIHAVLMTGVSGDTYQSGVRVVNHDDASRGSRGSVHLIGGMIEEIYPPFGTLNADGSRRSGYGRNFAYDRRMGRGFAPPYFPTTTQFELVQGDRPLAGARPVWREAAP